MSDLVVLDCTSCGHSASVHTCDADADGPYACEDADCGCVDFTGEPTKSRKPDKRQRLENAKAVLAGACWNCAVMLVYAKEGAEFGECPICSRRFRVRGGEVDEAVPLPEGFAGRAIDRAELAPNAMIVRTDGSVVGPCKALKKVPRDARFVLSTWKVPRALTPA